MCCSFNVDIVVVVLRATHTVLKFSLQGSLATLSPLVLSTVHWLPSVLLFCRQCTGYPQSMEYCPEAFLVWPAFTLLRYLMHPQGTAVSLTNTRRQSMSSCLGHRHPAVHDKGADSLGTQWAPTAPVSGLFQHPPTDNYSGSSTRPAAARGAL
ncbi:hypothetical protein ACOMHN_002590 [Nucella lapillus]